jgi:DNA polymerase-3 subunit alpha
LLDQFGTHTTATLRDAETGTQVAVGGVVNELKKKKSRKGDMWATFQLEDLEGQLEVLVFPKTFAAHEGDLVQDHAAVITGRVEIDEDRVRLIADGVCPMDKLNERQVEAVHVKLDAIDLDDQFVEKLMKAVETHRGSARLYFEVARPGVYHLVALAESGLRVTASKGLTQELESLIGPQKVHFRARGMLDS